MVDSPARPDRTAKVYLLRHGETEWSRAGQHTGMTDVSLTEAGERQASIAGRTLAGHPFELVLSSPRQRAIRTAQLAGFGERVEVDENLAEWDYGAYEGLTTPEIIERIGRSWYLWDDGVPAGDTPGETSEDVQRRVRAVIDRIMPVLDAGGDVLLVAHGHSLRVLAATWLDLPPALGGGFTLSTGTLSELGFDHDRPAVVRWNCPSGDAAEL